MNEPSHWDIDVFVGVDMAKEIHYAQAITTLGEELFHRPVLNDEPAITGYSTTPLNGVGRC